MSYGYSLSTLVEHATHVGQVRKRDLHPGDWVIVMTVNSVYSIRVDVQGFYLVSGGWFDRQGLSPVKISITGCTWGGSAIKVDIVAACGLCVEFGNRLITSRIRKIFIFPASAFN